MKVLIVEDEAIVAMGLEETLLSWGYTIAGIADNGHDAIRIAERCTPDLALIDISIKGQWDGIETATKLKQAHDFPIIYITAFSDRESIDRAKNTCPSAYLIKPYQELHLQLAIEMAIHNFVATRETGVAEPVASPADADNTGRNFQLSEGLAMLNHAVYIRHNKSFVKVTIDSISILEADGNYTHLFASGKKHTVKITLNNMLEKFPAGQFIRVHRSFAVNIAAIDTFSESNVCVGAREIPLGRSYKEHFMKHFDMI